MSNRYLYAALCGAIVEDHCGSNKPQRVVPLGRLLTTVAVSCKRYFIDPVDPRSAQNI